VSATTRRTPRNALSIPVSSIVNLVSDPPPPRALMPCLHALLRACMCCLRPVPTCACCPSS
jgi:hypothetical protein